MVGGQASESSDTDSPSGPVHTGGGTGIGTRFARKAGAGMSSSVERETGTIQWYDCRKAYGFIKPDRHRGYTKLFFHRTAIAPGWSPLDVSPGQDVEFSTERDEVGRLRAAQVTRLNRICFGCGKVGHRVKDCKDIPPGQSAVCTRWDKRGHVRDVCGRKCFACGETGHIAVHCPRKQVSPSLQTFNVGRDESFKEQEHHGHMAADPGLPGGAGAGSVDEDDDDCVTLGSSSSLHWGSHHHTLRKLFQNLLLERYKICKREEDSDEGENDCVLLNNNQQEEESDDDCIILEKNPFEEDLNKTVIDMSKKLSLSSDVKNMYSGQQTSHLKLQSLQEGPDHDELVIVAERGQVACRDYPHPRHLCVKYSFKDTPHHTYCSLCYCYVCDIKAPCKNWEAETEGHCHASERESKWVQMRLNNRIGNTSPNWHLRTFQLDSRGASPFEHVYSEEESSYFFG